MIGQFRCATLAAMSLSEVVAEYRAAKKALDDVRPRLFAAIAAAAAGGQRQVDIARETGFTRERVRQICREAGVEATE